MASTSGRRQANEVSCPYHPEAPLIEDYHAGDEICSVCALVVGDRVIDVGSEWRSFADTESKDMSRVGDSENPLLSGAELTTNVSYAGVSNAGSAAHSFDETGKQIYSQRNQMSSEDRALVGGFNHIRTMADRLGVPEKISQQANILYKQVREAKTLRSYSQEAITAACIYIACRQEHVTRSFKEVCGVCQVPVKRIGRAYKLIVKSLETNPGYITSDEFMTRFCSNLNLKYNIQKAATHIAKQAHERSLLTGRSPISLAAAAIFLASQAMGSPRTYKEIGDVVGVADSTIKQSYRLLYPHAESLFPDSVEVGRVPSV